MTWWWVGYTNDHLPRGQRALGAVIIEHDGPEEQIAAAIIKRGLAPSGGRPVFGMIDPKWGAPPDAWLQRSRHAVPFSAPGETSAEFRARAQAIANSGEFVCCFAVTNQEAEALAIAWDPGHRGLANAEDIAAAVADDDAKDGEPLFKRGKP